MEPLTIWYEQIQAHLAETRLKNLSEYTDKNGNNAYHVFSDIIRSKDTIADFSYSDFKHRDEFLFLSQDLIYIIAILEILRSRINYYFEERRTYTQTMEDHLYLRYAGFGYQVIYSYWDRIGDLLALFFRTGLTGDVYLGRVFNNFPQAYRSATYEELFQLYRERIEPVLGERHGVVHTFGLKSRHFWGALEHIRNDEELARLQEEKLNYPEVFRGQADLFFEGLTLALRLISELPDKVVPAADTIAQKD